jgi:quinol monooxygenase YgiN
MVIDLTIVTVRAGKADEFAKAFHDAWKRLGKVKGLAKWHLARGVEKPERFVFYGEWKSVDDHAALAKTPLYGALLAAVGPYLEGSPEILHYAPVAVPKKK